MKNSLIVIFVILPIILACSQLDSAINPAGQEMKSGTKTVDLPKDTENSVEDSDLQKESSVIVSITNNGIFIGDKSFQMANLGREFSNLMTDKTPEKRIVYINGERELPYGELVKLFDQIRQADIDRAGLIVETKEEVYGNKGIFEVKFPAKPKPDDEIKPNPLLLVISRTDDGQIKLNNEDQTLDSLGKRLSAVFKSREENGLFRQDTYEIEKTVFVKVPKKFKYEDVIPLVDAAKGAGANPIGMQIDDLP